MTDIGMIEAMEKAADYIVESGHFGKGRFFVSPGCHCTLGAYALGLGARFDEDGLMNFGDENAEASRRRDLWNVGWLELNRSVKSYGFGAVQSMNDEPETTAEQMAGVLRETAARLRGDADD
ncbi:hypothetical protein E6W39_18830 [Kitasatospora acidiphila]|uniref:Uncharacterized protein n=1 Tax=Kitasatospora acidiphila TaxID=2567942 RepID=A0A540W4E5_9ACTN|nr:hypothetical protein [Kitasatospora acidiphila]TQF03909.1 hypothetical protein E6W39_18830 [Kitasatospora acidiphila]